jgi:hypothetical protein
MGTDVLTSLSAAALVRLLTATAVETVVDEVTSRP